MDERKEMNFRELFYGIDNFIPTKFGKRVTGINFDNAATTPPFKSVVSCVDSFLPWYGSIGRGKGYKSTISTRVYNEGREEILKFFNLKRRQDYTVVFVKNATEGLNLLASVLVTSKDDIVITSRMEHHSNDLPWRAICRVEYIEVDRWGKLRLEELEEKLYKNRGRVKFVSITGASNVTGYVNDIHRISYLAHKYGAKIIVDGAQLVPHNKLNMCGYQGNDCIDFLVFSAHKMYAPYGVGAVVGLREYFEKNRPFMLGGGTVDAVMDNDVYWAEAPEKDEGGTPNVLGVLALIAAIKELSKIGYNSIQKHEGVLRDYLIGGLQNIPEVTMYGDSYDRSRLGIVVLNVAGIYHEDLAQMLSDYRGISVRNGCFCAQPYAKRLLNISEREALRYVLNPKEPKPGMVRVSFGLYNTIYEVNEFLNVMEYIIMKYKK